MKEIDGKIKLIFYRKISDVSDDDIVRMMMKYDCSCEVSNELNFIKCIKCCNLKIIGIIVILCVWMFDF